MSWMNVKAVPGRRVPVEGQHGIYFPEDRPTHVRDTHFIRGAIACGDLVETTESTVTIVGADQALAAVEDPDRPMVSTQINMPEFLAREAAASLEPSDHEDTH